MGLSQNQKSVRRNTKQQQQQQQQNRKTRPSHANSSRPKQNKKGFVQQLPVVTSYGRRYEPATLQNNNNNNNIMKIVIVGGVAGGASAAARARRLNEQADIVLLQSGPDISFASCGMPYYIGGEIENRKLLAVQTPASLHALHNIVVRVNSRVVQIDTQHQVVHVKNEKYQKAAAATAAAAAMSNGGSGGGGGESPHHPEGEEEEYYEETYDHLILAVGAKPIIPPIPGIDRPGIFSLRNLQDMDNIVTWINNVQQQAKMSSSSTTQQEDTRPHAVVAGAGFVGLEMVEQLVKRNMKVTLVELQKQILSPLDEEMAAFLHVDLEKKHGVTVIVNDGIQEFLAPPSSTTVDDGDDDSDDATTTATILRLASGRVLPPAHLIILGLGVRPDTDVIQQAGTIDCTPRGHVIVDEYLHTSAHNVWAVGDAVEVANPILRSDDDNKGQHKWAVPLAGPANRQGRMVADNILLDKRKKYKGTYGVSVVRSFSQYAACVGMNEKLLVANNIRHYSSVHIHPNSHAGYYPGASRIHLKLIFDDTSGKIYGAQAVGQDGVEKRIDVIATAMQGNMTVDDLAELELCYAPPVGAAKDPVNLLGMAAQNIVDGLVSRVEWNDLDSMLLMKDADDDSSKTRAATAVGVVVVDVRNPGEIATHGPIVDATQLQQHAGATTVVNIPLASLRQRLNELPKDKHLVVSCASGQRAYYACRILKQNGFEHVDNLDGAFITRRVMHPKVA
jgi:NADPH-dependent 2,4-dienoyl-CoA reductase/sulfur reductase-like enzyme/rhodanese-related sulfurtransferase